MALPRPISVLQTNAKSPVDQDLMESIRINLDYLDTQVTGGSTLFQFNLNGKLSSARAYRGPVDTAVYFSDFVPGVCRALLKKSGLSGSLRFDLRKVSKPKTPIIGIDHQFEGSSQSIARISSSIATQSVQRSIAQINTQSISFAKSQLSIQSIVNVGSNRWRYNLSGPLLDSDFVLGSSILIAGAISAGNNGTFTILYVNQSGFPSIVVNNPSGVAQTGAAGTADLRLYSYNYSNPVNSDYISGEVVTFATHTNALSNGQKTIYKTNQAGNNIWVFDATGVVQAGVAGRADVNRWIFAYGSAVSTDHYAIGETALMAAHTAAGNNTNKLIVDINRSGNNLIIYNPAGVVQGGAAGNASPNRWVYALSTNPSTNVTLGDTISFEGHTNAANNGIFDIKIVNFSASNNLVVFNQSGVAQAGSAGNPRHTRKLIKFANDESANYTTDSFIEMQGIVSGLYQQTGNREQFKVLEVNRGGGANYNVVIEAGNAPSQTSPAGFIILEAKSLFISPPSIPVELVGEEPDKAIKVQSTNFVAGTVSTNTPVLLYILEIPLGDPQDLTVILA
jgi:hypothetical protein